MKSDAVLHRAQKSLKEKGGDFCLIENPTDLFYLTGLRVSCGSLYIHKEAVTFFVDTRYLEMAKQHCPFPVECSEESAFLAFLKKYPGKKIFFDGNSMPHERFLALERLLGKEYQLSCESLFFKTLRGCKTEAEIKKLRQSADLLYFSFLHIKKKLKSGVKEKDLAREFEIFVLKHGGEGLSFSPIIAFGPHSALPHYRAGEGILQKGQIVLMDLGALCEGYHSDMTRTFFFGPPDPFLAKMQQIVLQAKKAALSLVRAGTRIGALDEAVISIFEAHGVREHYLHSLGHGVGLEVHEFPRISYKGQDKDVLLQEGMVITIEPGLYFPGRGGIREEDTIVVTRTGHSNFFPV